MRVGRRVLFVTASTQPWGAEQSLRILLASAPEGWSCSLLASSREVGEYCSPFVEELRLVAERNGKLSTLTAFARDIARVSSQYDVIVLFSLKLLPLALLIRAVRSDVRVIADVHDAPISLDRPLSRVLLRFVHRSIAISRFVVEHLRLQNAIVIPRPISDSPEGVVEYAQNYSTVALGVIGRIDPEKRIEVAIDAMRYLPSKYKLHVYGDPVIAGGDYLRTLRSRASDTARTIFRGRMAPEDIYNEVDAVIVCNEREPSGRTVGEAMLRGKLVFAPNRGGAQEYFDDSVSGYVYEALDAQSLARVVESAFDSCRDAVAVRRHAREKILAERSPQAVARHYFNVLEPDTEL